MHRQRPFYKALLEQELARRTAVNPRYSLRAFARSLNIDVSVLSRVFADKRTVSMRSANKLVEQLNLSSGERTIFLESVAHDQKLHAMKRAGVDEAAMAHQTKEVDAEIFKVIGDLHHFAILALTDVVGFVDDPRWIAQWLGLTVQEARLSIARLMHLGLLEQTPEGLRRSTKKIAVRDRTYVALALHRQQRQVLERALESLDRDGSGVRSFTGMTLALDPTKLALAKQLIAQFMDDLQRALSGGRPRRVYQLAVSLYPLAGAAKRKP